MRNAALGEIVGHAVSQYANVQESRIFLWSVVIIGQVVLRGNPNAILPQEIVRFAQSGTGAETESAVLRLQQIDLWTANFTC